MKMYEMSTKGRGCVKTCKFFVRKNIGLPEFTRIDDRPLGKDKVTPQYILASSFHTASVV